LENQELTQAIANGKRQTVIKDVYSCLRIYRIVPTVSWRKTTNRRV